MPGKQVAHYVYVFVAEAKLQGGSTDLTTEEQFLSLNLRASIILRKH